MTRTFTDFFLIIANHPCKSAVSVSSAFYFKLRRTHVNLKRAVVKNRNSAPFPQSFRDVRSVPEKVTV